MHFAAGPWFTVIESNDEWTDLGKAWLADGKNQGAARVQYRVTLLPSHELTTLAEVHHDQ